MEPTAALFEGCRTRVFLILSLLNHIQFATCIFIFHLSYTNVKFVLRTNKIELNWIELNIPNIEKALECVKK